jgi:[acyl-carrier-protein] S-malonyltransferase
MNLAILCSGQGRQHPDMFALTGDASEAAPLFAHAATLLDGRDARELVRNADDVVLHHNRVGQILCALQALAAASLLHDRLPARRVIAGYSVGEVAAWGVAGLFDPLATLDLVAKRAEAMDAVSPSGDGMLFVRGLAGSAMQQLCESCGAEIAIVNPGDAFILGGSRASLRALGDRARKAGAVRVAEIPVEVASHTSRLAAASPAFRAILERIHGCATPAPGTRLLSGIDAASVMEIGEGLDKLAAQISHTVHWADCLRACIESGATAMLELGPGRALAEMAAGTWPDIPARSLEDFRTLDGVRDWLRKQA